MKVAIGSDHNAFDLKEKIRKFITSLGYQVVDYGCYSKDDIDYPEIAFTVGKAILEQQTQRGILLCGTGIGMAIAACKIPGIRAALCHDVYSGERALKSNDAQIITLGSQIIGIEAAKKVVQAYLAADVVHPNSARKVKQITLQEQKNLQGNK